MYLTKRKDGLYSPSASIDHDESNKILIGSEIKAVRARNPMFHRKAMALLQLGFSNQDRIENFEVYRKVITIKAGYFDVVPTKNGEPYYIAKSLSYENMSQDIFEKWFEGVLSILSKELETKESEIKNQLENFY